VVWQELRHNLITNAGKAGVAKLTGGVALAPNAFSYLALGSGTTTPSLANVALENENTAYGSERKKGAVSSGTTTFADDTLKIEANWDFTGNVSVTEIGVLSSAVG